MWMWRSRKRSTPALRAATAYCCTAWDGPGASLAELREGCRRFARGQGLLITAWAAEVAPDDIERRYTELLRYTIEFATDPEIDALLIAESSTLVRSYGTAELLAKTLSPEGSRIVPVGLSLAGPSLSFVDSSRPIPS
ncbi:hypothetical protein [Amycolatopsis sp. CA-230715]|uniref:hypothetical protein n=1 Tax=Amycolatopsis sp. CA-230715 TaxID=2745196 RepID=UPI001C00F7F2|nr:hypothetical protein [Amycolatopsis sp. CA-230715]QWF80811.1 hypothetical protein HUW46_04235 [Amycolatopsis sp. CA-230715]